MPMKLSKRGAELIKSFEGCHKASGGGFKAYLCPANVLTIGWGHTNGSGRAFDKNSVWTQAECDAAFDEDMAAYEGPVNRMVQVPLKQHQFDALVSFAYNCGVQALRGSTLLKKVNARNFDGAALEFHKWVRGGGKVLPGLVRRRAAESMLFQDIPDRNHDGKPDMPQAAAIR